MAGIIQVEHGKYVIKAGKLGNVNVARAFPRPPSKRKGVVAEVTAKSAEEAIEALKAKIDTAQSEREASRRWDEGAALAVPLADEYAEALRQTHLSEAQAAMLKLHALAGDEGTSLPDLSHAAGYQSAQAGTSLYGKAARAVASFLDIPVPHATQREGDEPIAVLASPVKAAAAQPDQSVWAMHPEVRQAVEAVLISAG